MLPKIEHSQIVMQTAVPTERLHQNILDAAKHCLSPIDSLVAVRGDESIALIGGGPSLSDTYHLLDEYKYLMICGSAHDWINDHWSGNQAKYQDTYCIICDADTIMKEYLREKNKHITYLIASQCGNDMFEYLSDMPKKHIWHASGNEEQNKIFGEGKKLIVGGCTVGTRAIGMAMAMGFKKIHLYGFDSCLTSKYKHHAYDFIDDEKESLGEIKEIRLGSEDSPIFRVSGYMLGQIFDFKFILGNYADKLDIEVFGEGALAYLMKIAKQQAKEIIDGYSSKSNGLRYVANASATSRNGRDICNSTG